jgi:hypothetical protein
MPLLEHRGQAIFLIPPMMPPGTAHAPVSPARAKEHEREGPDCQDQQEQGDQGPEAAKSEEREEGPPSVRKRGLHSLPSRTSGHLNVRRYACIERKEAYSRDGSQHDNGSYDPKSYLSIHFLDSFLISNWSLGSTCELGMKRDGRKLGGCRYPDWPGQTPGASRKAQRSGSAVMEPYRNTAGSPGVAAWEIGPDYVTLQFSDESTYLYTYANAGQENVERMKGLARRGQGLNTFMNTIISKRYERKEK